MQGSLFCDWTDRQLADCHHPSQHTQAIQPKVCSELHQTVKKLQQNISLSPWFKFQFHLGGGIEIQSEDRLKTNFNNILSQTAGLLEAQRMWEGRTILAPT